MPTVMECTGVNKLQEIASKANSFSVAAGLSKTTVSFQHVVLAVLTLITQPNVTGSVLKNLSNPVYEVRSPLLCISALAHTSWRQAQMSDPRRCAGICTGQLFPQQHHQLPPVHASTGLPSGPCLSLQKL